MDLGNVYQQCGKIMGNCSVLFRILVGINRKEPHEGRTRADMEQALAAIDTAIAPIEQAEMDRPDARLVADEFRNAAAMLRLACHRGLSLIENAPLPHDLLAGVVAEHRRLWLARNRAGGLRESIQRLETGRTRPTA
jgi:hypothetical protein